MSSKPPFLHTHSKYTVQMILSRKQDEVVLLCNSSEIFIAFGSYLFDCTSCSSTGCTHCTGQGKQRVHVCYVRMQPMSTVLQENIHTCACCVLQIANAFNGVYIFVYIGFTLQSIDTVYRQDIHIRVYMHPKYNQSPDYTQIYRHTLN